MASSNRHWPSLFKSKPAPCNPHHQWQHDINHHPSSNPTVNNSLRPINPPRDEIRKIRVQLQEFGQVGDANVFYWFQNRKSRSKHKLRHSKTAAPPLSAATSSSSSSSDNNNNKPSPKSAGSKRSSPLSEQNGSAVLLDPNHHPSSYDFFSSEPPPFFMSAGQPTGFCFSEPAGNVVGPCTSLLLSDILNLNHHVDQILDHHHHDVGKKLHLDHQLCYSLETSNNNDHVVVTNAGHPPIVPFTHIPGLIRFGFGLGMGGGANQHHESEAVVTKTTVFINDVPFEVGTGPFNVREAFGDDMLLVHSSGQPVLTDDWGITLHSLHHGAFYYLVPFPTTAHHVSII
ncbi:WUSCHEL-related homeobox 9 [Linum perenne]